MQGNRTRPSGLRKTWKHTLNELHSQLSALEQQHTELQKNRACLIFRSRVLGSWLECLELLHASQPGDEEEQRGGKVASQYQAEKDLLVQRQQALQSQLRELGELPTATQRPRSSSAHAPAAPDSTAHGLCSMQPPLAQQLQQRPEDAVALPTSQLTPVQLLQQQQLLLQPLAPPHDPIAYFRDLASRPPPAGVELITSIEFARWHRDLALQLGVQLHLVENPVAPQLAALGTIRKLLDRHYHMMLALILRGRQDVVEGAKVFNLETLEPLDSDSPLVKTNQANIQSTVLPALQLTEAQADTTAYTMELCESLMTPIAEEIQQLQQQLNALIVNGISGSSCLLRAAGHGSSGDFNSSVASAATAAHAGDSTTVGGSRNGSMTSSSAPGAAALAAAAAGADDAIVATQRALEEQQKLLLRLKVVLKKQYHVAAASTGVFLGCLTPVQISKIILYRWPFTASLQFVAKAVWQQRRAQLQQQQQDQLLADQQWLQ